MNRNIFFCSILIISISLLHIKAAEDETVLDDNDLDIIDLKLWINLNEKIDLITDKIDKSFADFNKKFSELNKKLDTNEKNMKNQLEIIEKKIENQEQNAVLTSKLTEIQNKAKFEKLENLLKIKNAENQNIIEKYELDMNQSKIELMSKLDRLQNDNIEFQLESKQNKEEGSKIQLYTKLNETSVAELKKSSAQILENDIKSGGNCSRPNVYYCQNNKCYIQNPIYGPEGFLVACDQQTDNGGWTVIQRRINGSVDFYRDWKEYKLGFGNLDAEFWLGLDKLHALTSTHNMELRIILKDFNDTEKYANYNSFKIGNETEKYALKSLGEYDGNAGNAFGWHLGYKFTTKDQDNDGHSKVNCANDMLGAWWYSSCAWCNLNGKYFLPSGKNGIHWWGFHKGSNIKYVQMMIRPTKEIAK